MKTYLYNCHLDDFIGTPLHYIILGRRATHKYGYIAKSRFKKVLIDYQFSATIPPLLFKKLPKIIKVIVVRIEGWLWNRFNPSFDIVYPAELPDQYCLFAFSYKTAINWDGVPPMALAKASFVVMHLSHYFIRVSEKSDNLSLLKARLILAGDCDISQNDFFCHTFSWYKRKIEIIPFAVGDRFFSTSVKNEVSNKVLVTGTVDLIPDPNSDDSSVMFGFYNVPSLNRFRFKLAQEITPTFINNKISVRNRYAVSHESKRRWMARKIYQAIDFPNLLASHKYYCTGNEICGFPALSSFEAAATGAITIFDMSDIGIIPNLNNNFIFFDGTFDNLRVVVENLQSNPDIVELYKKLGRDFVIKNYSEDSLIIKFNGFFEAI